MWRSISLGPNCILTELRAEIRLPNYSIRTEQAYVLWTVRFIRVHHNKHPGDMHDREVAAFLTYLAVERILGANTRNLALASFVYRC